MRRQSLVGVVLLIAALWGPARAAHAVEVAATDATLEQEFLVLFKHFEKADWQGSVFHVGPGEMPKSSGRPPLALACKGAGARVLALFDSTFHNTADLGVVFCDTGIFYRSRIASPKEGVLPYNDFKRADFRARSGVFVDIDQNHTLDGPPALAHLFDGLKTLIEVHDGASVIPPGSKLVKPFCVLPPQTAIVTNGSPLTIHCKEIFVYGVATIRSFDRPAGFGQQAGDGGPIDLDVETISGGRLEILDTGQEGYVGAAGPAGARGEPGAAGAARSLGRTVLSGCASGGQGSPGQRGGPGGVGGMGGKGGDGGSVRITTNSATKKLIAAKASGGEGGKGGPGGRGGPGGPGGQPGPGDAFCGGGLPGPIGPNGENGSAGPAGGQGKNVPINWILKERG